MAQVGLKLVTLALLDDDGKILTGEDGLSESGIYPVTTKMLGTKTANITNITTNGTDIYGNNTKVDRTQAKGQPSIALDFNNLDFDIKQKILGRNPDGMGGYLQGDQPRAAVLVEAESLKRDASYYYGFANGQMSEAALNIQTDTNNESRVDDALTFTSFGVEAWNNEAMKVYYSGNEEFDQEKMYADVFGGYAGDSETTTTTTATPSEG
jgi:hypothetical protein